MSSWFMEKECGSLSKTRNMIYKASSGLGPGPWGIFNFGTWESNFPLPSRAVVVSPKATEWPVCDILEISHVSFMQHCLPCLLLTSHCVIVFADNVPFPIPPLKTVYKVLYFLINLFGTRFSLCKMSWAQFSDLLCFSSPGLLFQEQVCIMC